MAEDVYKAGLRVQGLGEELCCKYKLTKSSAFCRLANSCCGDATQL